MASAAMIVGVQDNGLAWKHEIKLQAEIKALVDLRETIEGRSQAPQLIAAYDAIVKKVTAAHASFASFPSLHEPLGRFINLELTPHEVSDIDTMFAGDPDAMIDAICNVLDELYDICDYHRVVIL